MAQQHRIAFVTLGCKVNQQETAALESAFRLSGYQVVPFSDFADVYVINSCIVTAQAERKSTALVRRARQRHKHGVVVLAGCVPQVTQAEGALGADLLVGNTEKPEMVRMVSEYLVRGGSVRLGVRPMVADEVFGVISDGFDSDRTRAFLKIQDGCQQYCHYCIIPYARGPERSLPMSDVLRQAEQLTASGFKEIVLTGIHLGSYGQDLPEGPNLVQLVRQMSGIKGLARIRLGSLEPNDIDEDLMALFSENSILCRHLHIPLQSGCDETLRRMGRRYDASLYMSLVKSLRRVSPYFGITTDLIVGFPGESEAEHRMSMEFLTDVSPLRTHVFRYSRRSGTPAANMPGQISEAVKSLRSEEAQRLAAELALANHRSLVGHEVAVLLERERNGLVTGHTGEYVLVSLPGSASMTGEIVRAVVTDASRAGTSAHCVEELS